MSVKNISLALNLAAIAVLIAGVVGIVTQAKSTTKRLAVPSSLLLPQIKVERMREVTEMSLAMDAYERLGSVQAADKSAAQAVASSNPAALAAAETFPSIFVGIDSRFGSVEQSRPLRAVDRSTYALANGSVRSGQAQVPKAKNAPSTEKPSAIDLPRVTVVAVSGQEPRAVINGNVVGVNDRLAGGYVVKQISIDSVVVSQGADDLLIKIPLERLRVLGAQESVRSKGP
jgi:hypothetical protein